MDFKLIDKFEQARKLFPHTENVIYFNSASYGPFSTKLSDAIKDNLDLRTSAIRDDSHDAFEMRMKLRAQYARMIGAAEREVGLGMSTSFGLNVAAFGLPFEEGDEILLSDVEFPAAVYTFQGAAKERGLVTKLVKSKDRCFDLEAFEKSITPKTKALCLSFVQYFNGFKNDLKKIGEICRKHNLYFVVDGIQGMGAEPIDVKEIGCDIFSSGGQKWLLAPQGCGFFYLSDEIRDKLRNPYVSWLSADWNVEFTDLFRYNLPYFDSAERFELGYYAVLNLIGMKQSADLIEDLGIENIRQHNHELIDTLADYIKQSDRFTITSDMSEKHRSSIFTFTGDNLEQVHRYLLDNNITLVRREGSIRVSIHLYNNEEDVKRFIDVLERCPQF